MEYGLGTITSRTRKYLFAVKKLEKLKVKEKTLTDQILKTEREIKEYTEQLQSKKKNFNIWIVFHLSTCIEIGLENRMSFGKKKVIRR